MLLQHRKKAGMNSIIAVLLLSDQICVDSLQMPVCIRLQKFVNVRISSQAPPPACFFLTRHDAIPVIPGLAWH